jgi:hypothetical protein
VPRRLECETTSDAPFFEHHAAAAMAVGDAYLLECLSKSMGDLRKQVAHTFPPVLDSQRSPRLDGCQAFAHRSSLSKNAHYV